MTDDEFDRWCCVIDRAIKGEHITIVCRDMRAATYDFRDCLAVCDAIGLAYHARKQVGRCLILIGDEIDDGAIDFSTMDAERRKSGDRRDLFHLEGEVNVDYGQGHKQHP